MSATDRTAADFEAAAVAHVHFRVRCETLGHGEEVYLVPHGGGIAKVSLNYLLVGHVVACVSLASTTTAKSSRNMFSIN